MGSKLAPFAELSSFESLDASARLALGALLAESLGPDFRPLSRLVGTKQMACVEHAPSGVELVAILGGGFEMGFTERGRDLILSGNACRHWNPDLLVGEERRQEGDEGVPRMSRAERRTTCPPRSRSPTV